MFRTA